MGVTSVVGITLAYCTGGAIGGLGGVLEGCFAGGVEGLLAYNLILNPIESYLSVSSTTLTLAADFLDDRQLGESSHISVNATLMGLAMVDPFTDLAIDGYVSGYNHGFFNGFDSIIFGGPIINDP